VVAPKAKEPGAGSAPPAGFQADRFDGRIAASPIPADQIAKRTRAFANAYSATLAADAYLEQTHEALRGDDDGDARHCLAVIAAIVEVAIAQLRKPSDPIALAGNVEAEVYTPDGGEARVSWRFTADAVLTARKAKREGQS
jgi:hypothetical protein